MLTALFLVIWGAAILLLLHVGSGLVVQNDSLLTVSLGTLAAQTPIILTGGIMSTSLAHSFLVKKIKINLHLDTVVPSEGPFYVGMAFGDATVGEIQGGLQEANTSGPHDTTQVRTQDNAFNIVQMSLTAGEQQVESSTVSHWNFRNEISFGKGIPFQEGQGWNWFVYNAGNGALTTGSGINGHCQAMGVWLN